MERQFLQPSKVVWVIDVEIGYCEDACHGDVDDDNEDDKKIEEKMKTAIAKLLFGGFS